MKKLFGFLLITCCMTFFNCNKDATVTLRISGAWALYPMVQIWADEYQKITPVKIEVTGGGAGKGMSDVLNGQVDIAMCSRPIKKEELDLGAFYVSVTKDAVIAIVNSKNPILQEINIRGLSRETLTDIFMKKISRWGDIVQKEFPNDTIVVYGRADASGAAKVWANFLGNYSQADIQNNADANFNGDQALCNGIKTDPNAIGFCNLNYAYDMGTGGHADGIQPVPLDLNQNQILDNSENFYARRELLVKNITGGIYPSPPSRLEYLVSKGPFTKESEDFIQWILTDGQKFVEENGYVKLPEKALQKEIGFLKKGTRNK